MSHPTALLRSLALGLGLLLAGCGSDATAPASGNSTGSSHPASLTLVFTTAGATLDPSGYSVAIDDGAPRRVQRSGSVAFESLDAGNHRLRVTGIARNCSTAVELPETIQLPRGRTTRPVRVTCDSALTDVIVFSGFGSPLTPLLAVHPGTGAVLGSLTSGPAAFDRRSSVSPDGRFVAFARITPEPLTGAVRTMQVMQLRVADGRLTPLTDPLPWVDRIAWRPDGRELLVTADFPGRYGAYRVPLDGGVAVPAGLEGLGWGGTVCPNGEILTTGVESIDRLSAAGLTLERLSWPTVDDPQAAAWAPGSAQVAFFAKPGPRDLSTLPGAIFVYDRRTGVLNQVTEDAVQSQDPTWSPSASRLAYIQYVSSRWNLVVMDVTGGRSGSRLIAYPDAAEPNWAPDVDDEGSGER